MVEAHQGSWRLWHLFKRHFHAKAQLWPWCVNATAGILFPTLTRGKITDFRCFAM
jgi:hypothetical protein